MHADKPFKSIDYDNMLIKEDSILIDLFVIHKDCKYQTNIKSM